MDRHYPVYTVLNDCQDCFRCVRECPVKAIKVENGSASVIPELCVGCGHCVQICPADAKRVRDDIGRAELLLEQKDKVYVSLAPSWVSEFPGVSESAMVQALISLGFAGVGETALGAEQISAAVRTRMKLEDSGNNSAFVSSACPAVVEYIRKHDRELLDNLCGMDSPLRAHARLMRKHFGDKIAVVFIGPCVAKKTEADHTPDLVNLSLTFSELRRWWGSKEIDPAGFKEEARAQFAPEKASDGALYPIEGGMIETVKSGKDKAAFYQVSGLQEVIQAFKGIENEKFDEPVFIEALACKGGCINGPCHMKERSPVLRHVDVMDRVKKSDEEHQPVQRPTVPVNHAFQAEDLFVGGQEEAKIKEALAKIGKYALEDEINCGGCGYDNCRSFAGALLDGRADTSMCVSYMRKLAQRKANALVRCMPAGVVVVNQDLSIIEHNDRFKTLLGLEEEAGNSDDETLLLSGRPLTDFLPFATLFKTVLKTGNDARRKNLSAHGRLWDVTVFSISRGQTVGGIVQDVTGTELKRDQIARRANEVITKNLTTVQTIACMLGEHMADTEILLRSIAEDYAGYNPADTDAEMAEEDDS